MARFFQYVRARGHISLDEDCSGRPNPEFEDFWSVIEDVANYSLRQKKTWGNKVYVYLRDEYEMDDSVASYLQRTLRPGHSRHAPGLAVHNCTLGPETKVKEGPLRVHFMFS